MSIRRQLAMGISVLLLIIMMGNMWTNIHQIKHHFEQQLKARADETATTLALSMTQSANLEDDAVLRSMVDVIFDRGYFAEIRFDYVANDRFVARYAVGELAPDVPAWFVNWMPLYAAVSSAQVTQGWQQLGELSVKLHAGFVYSQLWRLVKAEIAWFALMLFLSVYTIRILLNWQLKPLKEILQLAEDLANQQYAHIEKTPKAPELARLVSAMNRLSDRLHASAIAHGETVRQLQVDSFSDQLTQLQNRKGWDQFLNDWMKADGFAPGWVMLIQLENLQNLNQQYSKAEVDELLMQIALLLKTDENLRHENVHLARTSGGEFWVFCPDPLDAKFSGRITQLASHLSSLSLVVQFNGHLKIAALPIYEVVAPSSLKHQLDVLIHSPNADNETVQIGKIQNHTFTNWVHWQKKLSQALAQKQIKLFAQPVFNPAGEQIQQEIHCRLVDNEQNEPLLAGFFWPMVDKLNLSVQFDRLIIDRWREHVLHNPTSDWVLNISGKSLNDSGFRHWLKESLSEVEIKHFIMEFSEFTLVHSSEQAQQWLREMVVKGMRLSVDHVGTSGRSFGFLARFPLYQGKIERRFIRNIDQQKEHACFVSGMVQVFHGQKALCVAEGVETEHEQRALNGLNVDGLMGYGLGKPQAL